MIRAIWQLYYENRKYKRLLAEIKMEAKRLRLIGANKDIVNYLEELHTYLKEA